MRLAKVEKTTVKFKCPRCGEEIPLVIWGQGWDWDMPAHPCEHCGYDDYLDTMTGHDPDGSIYQVTKEEFDEENTA